MNKLNKYRNSVLTLLLRSNSVDCIKCSMIKWNIFKSIK